MEVSENLFYVNVSLLPCALVLLVIAFVIGLTKRSRRSPHLNIVVLNTIAAVFLVDLLYLVFKILQQLEYWKKDVPKEVYYFLGPFLHFLWVAVLLLFFILLLLGFLDRFSVVFQCTKTGWLSFYALIFAIPLSLILATILMSENGAGDYALFLLPQFRRVDLGLVSESGEIPASGNTIVASIVFTLIMVFMAISVLLVGLTINVCFFSTRIFYEDTIDRLAFVLPWIWLILPFSLGSAVLFVASELNNIPDSASYYFLPILCVVQALLIVYLTFFDNRTLFAKLCRGKFGKREGKRHQDTEFKETADRYHLAKMRATEAAQRRLATLEQQRQAGGSIDYTQQTVVQTTVGASPPPEGTSSTSSTSSTPRLKSDSLSRTAEGRITMVLTDDRGATSAPSVGDEGDVGGNSGQEEILPPPKVLRREQKRILKQERLLQKSLSAKSLTAQDLTRGFIGSQYNHEDVDVEEPSSYPKQYHAEVLSAADLAMKVVTLDDGGVEEVDEGLVMASRLQETPPPKPRRMLSAREAESLQVPEVEGESEVAQYAVEVDDERHVSSRRSSGSEEKEMYLEDDDAVGEKGARYPYQEVEERGEILMEVADAGKAEEMEMAPEPPSYYRFIKPESPTTRKRNSKPLDERTTAALDILKKPNDDIINSVFANYARKMRETYRENRGLSASGSLNSSVRATSAGGPALKDEAETINSDLGLRRDLGATKEDLTQIEDDDLELPPEPEGPPPEESDPERPEHVTVISVGGGGPPEVDAVDEDMAGTNSRKDTLGSPARARRREMRRKQREVDYERSLSRHSTKEGEDGGEDLERKRRKEERRAERERKRKKREQLLNVVELAVEQNANREGEEEGERVDVERGEDVAENGEEEEEERRRKRRKKKKKEKRRMEREMQRTEEEERIPETTVYLPTAKNHTPINLEESKV